MVVSKLAAQSAAGAGTTSKGFDAFLGLNLPLLMAAASDAAATEGSAPCNASERAADGFEILGGLIAALFDEEVTLVA